MRTYLENDAVLSDCGKYRYLLRRTWDHGQPRALLIMLNPSTADAKVILDGVKALNGEALAVGAQGQVLHGQQLGHARAFLRSRTASSS